MPPAAPVASLGGMTRQSTLLTAVLTLRLATAGCGGSSARPSPAPAAPRPHAAIADRCAARAGGDPGAMGLCLAAHHVVVPDDGRMVNCVQAADTRADVTACLAKAVR